MTGNEREPRSPRNTARDFHEDPAEPLLLLAIGMTDGPSAAVEHQEQQGQREIVNSDVIPAKIQGSEEELTALGFVLSGQVEGDPLFRYATLPQGWRREGSEHAMWSFIVDGLGRRRCSVFYKAAFYDRDAHISVTTVRAYVNECLFHDRTPVLDEEWASREAVLEALAAIRAYADEKRVFWAEHGDDRYVREYGTEIAKCDELKRRIENLPGGEA